MVLGDNSDGGRHLVLGWIGFAEDSPTSSRASASLAARKWPIWVPEPILAGPSPPLDGAFATDMVACLFPPHPLGSQPLTHQRITWQ